MLSEGPAEEEVPHRTVLPSNLFRGVGLNLTAADYVYILDPWSNPAVEAQAIDRAHRIGQERAEFAYRMVGRDTVEVRILELQATKREIADAILAEDAGAGAADARGSGDASSVSPGCGGST